MIGALIGAACGTAEYFLLKKLTAVLAQKQAVLPVGLVLAKIAVLAACMLACAFIAPKQLIWAATAAVAMLLILSVVGFVKQSSRNKENS